MPWRSAQLLLSTVITVASLSPLSDYYLERRESQTLKQACEYVKKNWQPGDIALHTLKYSYASCLYYHDYKLEERFLSDNTLDLFRIWYDKPALIELGEAAAYDRVWVIAPNRLSDNAVNGLLKQPRFAERGAQLRYRSPADNLLLVEFNKAP